MSKMVSGLSNVDPERKQRLLEVLDIDLDWKMHLVSDGQRRRVQLLMGLLKPFEVRALSQKFCLCGDGLYLRKWTLSKVSMTVRT